MYRKVIRYVMSAMKIGQNYAQRCITKWTKKIGNIVQQQYGKNIQLDTKRST